MKKALSILLTLCCAAGLSVAAWGAEPASGWRGNATGLWPNGNVPLQWGRIAHGAMEGLRVQADRASESEMVSAAPVRKGLIGEWLVLGPFAVRDSVENLDDDLLDNEPDIAPTADDQTVG